MSNTTLTGRQWGIAPALGAAWQPGMFHSKVVVRSGGGMYYDRGELFTYLSPGYAIGTVTGGPFGVNQQLPFVNVSTCPTSSQSLYEYYIPTCGGNGGFNPPTGPPTAATGNLENPYGTTLQYAAPSNPKASDLSKYLPNAYSIIYCNGLPASSTTASRSPSASTTAPTSCPTPINYTLDIQWQPRNDLAIELGYVGNIGRHQVIPLPFNQPLSRRLQAPLWLVARTSRSTAMGTTWEAHRCPTAPATRPTMRAATWICACLTSATRRSRSLHGRGR